MCGVTFLTLLSLSGKQRGVGPDTDTVELTVKTLVSQLSGQFFTETVELTVKTLLSQLSRQFFTDAVEWAVKTLVSQLSRQFFTDTL